MSNNLTEKLQGSLEDKIDRLISIVESIDSRLGSLETRFESLEARVIGLETRFESLEARVIGLETRFESLEARVIGFETRFIGLETRFGGFEIRLETIEAKVDQRLRDTQPIWEAVQTQLAEIRELLQRLDESQQSLRADTEKGFRTFDRRMERQIGEFERLHAYQRDLEDRVDKIEKLSTP